MVEKYLNFEFWFYQIYLLFQELYKLVTVGPQAVSILANAVFSVIFSLIFAGLFIYALYTFEIAKIYIVASFLILGLVSYFFLSSAGIFMALSALFFLWLIYSVYNLGQVRKREKVALLSSFAVVKDPETERREEWQDILDHIDSDNESQWKLALIDADKILENLLRQAGYEGDGIGDRLKTAEVQGGLRKLQEAWEAHKIRNRIAHESGFILTKRDAKRAVELYKRVFEELGYI